MEVVLSLAAALCFALASVFQHRGVQGSTPHARRGHAIVVVMRSPPWLLGGLADAAAVVLQYLALGRASIVLVQPLLVTGLLFALGLSAILARRVPTRVESVGALAIALGLAGFLVATDPGPATIDAGPLSWAMLGLAALAVVGVAVLASRRLGRAKAPLLGFAAGVGGGVTGAFLQAFALDVGAHGWLGSALHWEPWVLLAAGIVTLGLSQLAFSSGDLAHSLPALAVADPVTGVLVGVAVLGQPIATSPLALGAAALTLVVMAGGVVVLAPSTLPAPKGGSLPALSSGGGRPAPPPA